MGVYFGEMPVTDRQAVQVEEGDESDAAGNSGLVEESIRVWENTRTCFPLGERTYSPAEQSANERLLDGCLGTVEKQLRRAWRTTSARANVRGRITTAFVEFAKPALGLDNSHIALLLEGGFATAGAHLGRYARRFDAAISSEDLFQACRNAWVACGLQSLFGRAMVVTPSIFAYSMLYPYSDNYLDDPTVGSEAKRTFSDRFRKRLEGRAVPTTNVREEVIWELIGLIEAEYDRVDYLSVYESLLAIHRSQEESIRLADAAEFKSNREKPLDVTRLVFAKGGDSVLADGYLAAGRLTDAEARFTYEWGVLLQLGDDLQDIREDAAAGIHTLFSRALGREPLDELTNRTFHFAREVLARMAELEKAPPALKELIGHSTFSLLIRAAGAAREFYSERYIAKLEACSPFRFAFLDSRRGQLARRQDMLERLGEVFLTGEDVESFLPPVSRLVSLSAV
jgi:hypothetical protein